MAASNHTDATDARGGAGELQVTPEMLMRYNRPTPRYTSYPTADRFHEGFGPDDYAAALERANATPDAPLSLYVHLPFCTSMCTYCGCSVVITNREDKKTKYLDHLIAEIDLVAERLPDRRRVAQLHWGGGSPNAYDAPEMRRLIEAISARFELLPGAELAIEIDPRKADAEQVAQLRDVGFNRLSMGIQDFDDQVQRAVNRVQPFELSKSIMDAARAAKFHSVSVDLIYGLPYQRPETYADTLERALSLSPDRIALFSFAYVPWIRPHQKKIDQAAMPSVEEKFALFCQARDAFLDAGYVAIGMDHFARPDDEMALAHREGRLRRNFQGYTVLDAADVIGLGMTSIGDVAGAYAQNRKKLADYLAAIRKGELATERGFLLTEDDAIRRSLISDLMCRFELVGDEVRERLGLDLRADFSTEMERIDALVDEGLVTLDGERKDRITVTPVGQLFVRIVASAFDWHLHTKRPDRPAYSRAV